MSPDPQTFLRIRMLKNFLQHSANLKKDLMEELIVRATDPVIRMRRFRMLRQLSLYESQIIQKIQNLDTNDVKDFLADDVLLRESYQIVDKSA